MKAKLLCVAISLLFSLLCVAGAYGEFYVIAGRANYKGVVVVAKSGGQFTSIQAAIDSIDTPSDSNRWLVQVAPGVYSERVAMREFVDIAGSGASNTIITSPGSESETTATLTGANNAVLRDLTVQCKLSVDSFSYTIAIFNDGVAPTLDGIAVVAQGGSLLSIGILNDNGSDTVMRDVSVVASGALHAYGVENHAVSEVTMTDMEISAHGTAGSARAVYTDNSSARVTRVRALASGGSSYGFYNRLHQTSGLIVLDTVSTSDDFLSYPQYGVFNALGADVRVYNSRLAGSSSAVTNDQSVSGTYGTSTARIANSMLSASADGGEFTCVGCYSGLFAGLDGSCQ